MKELREGIGQRIKALREAKGLNQTQLGKLLGYSPMGISYFEQGKRDLKISDLKLIAEFFKVEMSDFLPKSQTLYRKSDTSSSINASLKSFDEHILSLGLGDES